MSEPESLNQKWRGWASKSSGFNQTDQPGPSGLAQESQNYSNELQESRNCASGLSQPRCASAGNLNFLYQKYFLYSKTTRKPSKNLGGIVC